MTKQLKTGVLLINLGTPNTNKTDDVRKYLRQFLMDRRIIDIPFWKRFLLVNLIIVPFRSPRSAKEYSKLWTEKGSPLLHYSLTLKNLVQESLGENFLITIGMRYQNPSIDSALKILQKHHIENIIIFPLFPQYASATTGSIHERVMQIIQKWLEIPKLHFINSFYDHPKMLKTFVQRGKYYLEKEIYDHILFTYHGLPERQLKKANTRCLTTGKCCDIINKKNQFCYRAQCFETSRCLAKALHLSSNDYSVSFQSRLGKSPWIRPYTDETITTLANKGIKKILVFSPSFVADCLETIIEIGEQYRNLFIERGGENLQLVESLNVHPMWVEAIRDIIMQV